MAITAISNALPVKNSQVAFIGKKDENIEAISHPKKAGALKSVPVIVLMAMTPSMINAGDTNNELFEQLNSVNAVELYESSQAKQPKIISSKTIGGHTVNLISVDGDDRNFEELEYYCDTPTGIVKRGIIKAVMYGNDGDTPLLFYAGISLPKENVNSYDLKDLKGAKYVSGSLRGPAAIMVKDYIESQANSTGIINTTGMKKAPLSVLMPKLNSEIDKYKANHNVR